MDADGFGACYLAGFLAVSSASRRLPTSVNTKRPPRVRLISPIDISSSRASLDKNLASPLATRRSELTSAELSEAFGLRRRMMRQRTRNSLQLCGDKLVTDVSATSSLLKAT